jgi:CheY-like chemotaxis protein
VLVADDDPDAVQTMAILLELDGHHCTFATDGATVLRLFEQLRPDVLLLDIGMPRCSGYEVARGIRALATDKPVLLIAVTGWVRESDKARAYDAGFDHHLPKPVDYDLLAALLAV